MNDNKDTNCQKPWDSAKPVLRVKFRDLHKETRTY